MNMTLAIILFIMVLLGIVLFGYGFQLNKQHNKNREDAIKSRREEKTGEN